MRLSQSASVSKREKNLRLSNSRSRKKHKRLDAICEKAYTRNHVGVETKSSECNVGDGLADNESELRRSTRVRRAPVVLDASPPPAKKRRRMDKSSGNDSVGRMQRRDGLKIDSPCSTSKDAEEEPGSWRSRLRSRAKNVSFGVGKKGYSSPRGKRKLFDDLDGFNEEAKLEIGELDDKKEEFASGKSTVVKSKRPGRIKASNILRNAQQEIEPCGIKEDSLEKDEAKLSEYNDEDNPLQLENEGEVKIANPAQLVEEEDGEVPAGLDLEDHVDKDLKDHIDNENVEVMGLDKQVEASGSVKGGEKQRDAVETSAVCTGQAEDGECDNKFLKNENASRLDKKNHASTDTIGKPRMKEGRRCGLCGGGTDGKPPKKLRHDEAASDNETYSGSSASEDPNYDIWDGFGDEPGWLGRLLGPINDRFGIAGIWVHQHCAVWSPEVYFAGLGRLKNVRAALCRGRVLKCTRCGRPGATIGCRVDRCPKTYHLPCARANGCIFDHRKFLIACTDHRHLFQPHGSQYLFRIKKMKAKKMKLEMKKLSNESWRKDLEAEEKWLENCGEDEEFLKRESKRLHRDLLRIAPVYIGGPNSDSEMSFQGWESVAGLQDVIQCLKEVVILPLLYPEFFSNVGLTPPRGVLLHGYPGTGKTLVVRALVGSCARGDKRIAYFARKGADCLGKYVGDAERQLRLLFQVAEKSQPSIIFFDEIDGLAPCRTRQQDQTHNSVVSTLLALLDGLKSRGSVVVIGATNRPDAVDPALRRPGRFDREIYFPLPSLKDREAILSLQTRRWPKPITGPLLHWIARRTVGFAGADLQALCTQAAIIALRRNCSLHELLSAAGNKVPHGKRPPLPAFTVEERDWLEAVSCAPPPCSRREAGMAANDVVSSPLKTHLISFLLQPLSRLLVSLYLDERLWLPPSLSKAASLIKNVIISALDKRKVQSDNWWSHLHDLLQEADVVREIESSLSHAGILIGDSCYASFDALDTGTDDNSSKMLQIGTCTSFPRNISYGSGKKSGFRILISGDHRYGQRYLASCLLHSFVGNVEIRKIDLSTISQEGHGDLMQGITNILMRCASVGLCMVFMPRIDLWARESCEDQLEEEENGFCSRRPESSEQSGYCLTNSEVTKKAKQSCPKISESGEMLVPQHADAQRTSHIWRSFIEQVESICVSTSLMILATSEVPFPQLPLIVRQFFKNDMLNCNLSTPLLDTLPQFSVQVDRKFSCEMALNASAAKISKDLVTQFVQWIHHRNHLSVRSFKEDKTCDIIKKDADVVCSNKDLGLSNEHVRHTEYPDSSVTKVPFSPKSRNPRGKTNLLLAISMFGYQILRYPHFAELCWITSKLKDGPCADISGPWKGWPFNSCIVRPNNLAEKVAVGCSSGNVKGKENFGLVRGLIAVGLSAYRGLYTSLREVSSEVRKVLELLAGEINSKIQAGKERYQFIRVSSQLAHFEDMVNSWAYTLRSLEGDAQVTVVNPKPTGLGSLESPNACEDILLQSDRCKPDISTQGSYEPEVLMELPQGFVGKNIECADLSKKDQDSVCAYSEGGVAVGEVGPQEQIHHSASDFRFQSSVAMDDPVGGKLLNEQNGINPETFRSENPGNHTEIGGRIESLQHSNGFCPGSIALLEDGPCDSGPVDGSKFSSLTKDCNVDGFPPVRTDITSRDGNRNSDEFNVDVNSSSSKSSSISTDSGVACFYRCCSECLYNLHHSVQKFLSDEWGLGGNDWTVEDINDAAVSLSLNLHSALRKLCFPGSKQMGNCCEISNGRSVTPTECSHSRNKIVAANATSWNPQYELDSEFIFRDGILAQMDSDKDVSFHCKFQTLSLCSLIGWIQRTKQPLG